MAWRVARSLDQLLSQLNAQAPRRSKVSDGSIGDAAHASRSSDHNPWYGPGIVTARDFTHDPAGGLDCQKLADALVRSGDKRIKYIIWNHRIWQAGRWTAYNGINPHTKHLHLSVAASALADNTAPWNLTGTGPTVPQEVDVVLPTLKEGDGVKGTPRGVYVWYVLSLQALLRVRGLRTTLAADGVFGPATTAAVKELQSRWKLAADGVVGPGTWSFVLGNEAPDYGPKTA